MSAPGDTLPVHIGSINEQTGLTHTDVQSGEKSPQYRVRSHHVVKVSDLQAYLVRQSPTREELVSLLRELMHE